MKAVGLDMLGLDWNDIKKGWGVAHETVMPIAAQIPIASAFVPLADSVYSAATGKSEDKDAQAKAQVTTQAAQQAKLTAVQNHPEVQAALLAQGLLPQGLQARELQDYSSGTRTSMTASKTVLLVVGSIAALLLAARIILGGR